MEDDWQDKDDVGERVIGDCGRDDGGGGDGKSEEVDIDDYDSE